MAGEKLSAQQWLAVQKAWEEDARTGFAWVVKEKGLPVSRKAVEYQAKKNGWMKITEHHERAAEVKTKGVEEARKQRKEVRKETRKQGNKKDKHDDEHQSLSGEWEQAGSNDSTDTGDELPWQLIDNVMHGNSLYDPRFANITYHLCLLGYTDEQVADALGVSETTVNNWKKKYPDFFESILRGRHIADSQVAHALYQKAVGYTHRAIHFAVSDGRVITTEYDKHYPPDTNAARLFLNNRQSRLWQHKVDPEPEIDDSDVPDEDELNAIYEESLERSKAHASKVLGRAGRLNLTFDDEETDL